MPNRRLTAAVTLLALTALLVAGIVLGTRALLAPLPKRAASEPAPTCTTKRVDAGRRVTTGEVTVSVFNAGDISGLATSTLDGLIERGFVSGDTGNAPTGTNVTFVQVWTTAKNDAAAELVARQFGPKTSLRKGKDLGLGVDVVVGSQFRGLVPAPRSIRVHKDQEVCVASGG